MEIIMNCPSIIYLLNEGD